jgi:hypothetical protein
MMLVKIFVGVALLAMLHNKLVFAQEPEPPPKLQMCSGETPVTCLFHAWMHSDGPDAYCAKTWQDCPVNLCPEERPFLCHRYGFSDDSRHVD